MLTSSLSDCSPTRRSNGCRLLPNTGTVQVESTRGKNEWKVWLTPDEYRQLAEHAKGRAAKHYATILLGGRVGLRSQEIAGMCYNHLRDTDDGHYRLHVPEPAGKDTTGPGQAWDAWVPSDVELVVDLVPVDAHDLLRIRYELDAQDDERLLGVKTRRVRPDRLRSR